MKEAKFKVGDKVIILDGSKIKDYTAGWCGIGMNQYIGQIVTISQIINYDDGRFAYIMNETSLINWDERGLEPAEMKVIIWRSDREVHAKNIPSGKEAIAKCSPEDEFNFMTGAKLALERLEELEKPKLPKPLAVGDEVRVIDTGKLYVAYDEWISKNVEDDKLKIQFAYGDDLGYLKSPKTLKREEKYIIRVINKDKAYIQKSIYDHRCHLIRLDGLERW